MLAGGATTGPGPGGSDPVELHGVAGLNALLLPGRRSSACLSNERVVEVHGRRDRADAVVRDLDIALAGQPVVLAIHMLALPSSLTNCVCPAAPTMLRVMTARSTVPVDGTVYGQPVCLASATRPAARCTNAASAAAYGGAHSCRPGSATVFDSARY